MSRTSKRKSPAPRGGNRRSSRGTYEVGYGRPPKKTQFKPGQSGNPRGRPKGAKGEATILHEMMTRNIEIREGARTRKISVLAAILLRFAENALKGDAKSATFLLNRYGAVKCADEGPESNQDDEKILSEFILETCPSIGLRRMAKSDRLSASCGPN